MAARSLTLFLTRQSPRLTTLTRASHLQRPLFNGSQTGTPFKASITPRYSSTMAPLPSTQTAIKISKNGGLDVLETDTAHKIPSPSPTQILVRNAYAGVNFIDTYFRSGLYPAPHLPLTLGREASGTIVAVGSDVKGFKEGDEVVYMCGQFGSYTQFSPVEASKVIKVPAGVSLEQAAAVYLQGLTAWTLVKEAGEVKAGQWTLVHAAAGGVGLLLVQMLRAVGAKVIGTASTQEKLDLAKKNGAEWTVNSGDDVVAKVNEITGGHGIDVIFDGVGKATFEADMEMVALKGSLISFGNASGAVDPFSILRLGKKNVRLMRPVVNGYVSTREELEKHAGDVFELVKNGKLEVKVHEVYPLTDAKRAQADIESRKTTGKLLLKCN